MQIWKCEALILMAITCESTFYISESTFLSAVLFELEQLSYECFWYDDMIKSAIIKESLDGKQRKTTHHFMEDPLSLSKCCL